MEWDEPWPSSWPAPDIMFKSLRHCLVLIHARPLLVGKQIIIRFRNGFGANILDNWLQEGLTEVMVIKFNGVGENNYDFVSDTPIPDLNWCHSYKEVLELCNQISRLPDNQNISRKSRPEP